MACCPDRAGRCLLVSAGAILAVFAATAFGSGVAAQASRGEGVIARLTAETKAEAVACGRAGPTCAIAPYELCPRTSGYRASLVTPFSRVAKAAYDDARGAKPLGRMGPLSVNRWGIAVSVAPAAGTPDPDAIVSVEIRRGGQGIAPQKSTVGPMAVKNAAGSVVSSRRGFFVFPAAALDSSVEIDVVFIGSRGESICHLDQARLRALR
jgi:hypothetical protein